MAHQLSSPSFSAGALPRVTRPDAAMVMSSEWITGTPEHQRTAAEAAMAVWEHTPWPDDLLHYTCYLGTDGRTLLHYSQWTHEDAYEKFAQADPPERVRSILSAVPDLERRDLTQYRRYGSFVANTSQTPGCIVVVKVGTEDAERAEQWTDAVCRALDVQSPAGLLSAHFHISRDGTQVLNYAEWTNEAAHRHSVDQPAQGPDWRLVQRMAGIKPLGFKRYNSWRSAFHQFKTKY